MSRHYVFLWQSTGQFLHVVCIIAITQYLTDSLTTWIFNIRRTTFLNLIKLADLLIW